MTLSIFHSGNTRVAGPVPTQRLQDPEVSRAFRTLKRWVLAYLVTSTAALIAAFLVPFEGSTGSAIGVWIRCCVVTVIAAIIYVLARRAQRGHRRAYAVLRVFAWLESIGFILVALIVPGYPTWLRIATAIVGVFAVGTAVVAGNRHLRAVFARLPPERAPSTSNVA